MTPQKELFKAETAWFHIFKTMIDNGDVARMGPYAVTVYLVIKSHTNFATGRAFPALETIAEKERGITRTSQARAENSRGIRVHHRRKKRTVEPLHASGKNRDQGRHRTPLSRGHLGLFARVSFRSSCRSEERDHDWRHVWGEGRSHREVDGQRRQRWGGRPELQRVKHPRGRSAKNRRTTQNTTRLKTSTLSFL